MGKKLKVVRAEFSTLSLAVLQNVYNSWPIQALPSLDLKTRKGFFLFEFARAYSVI